MGTNVAPILANIYLAKLEKLLLEKCKTDKKLIWPTLFRRFINDGFGVTKGSKKEFEYWEVLGLSMVRRYHCFLRDDSSHFFSFD